MCAGSDALSDATGNATASGNSTSTNQAASATTCVSAATLPHLLIAVLAIAGVMTMGGGLLIFGSCFSAAPRSLVSSLPVTSFTVTGVLALGK